MFSSGENDRVSQSRWRDTQAIYIPPQVPAHPEKLPENIDLVVCSAK
jgi:hypothetical protein